MPVLQEVCEMFDVSLSPKGFTHQGGLFFAATFCGPLKTRHPEYSSFEALVPSPPLLSRVSADLPGGASSSLAMRVLLNDSEENSKDDDNGRTPVVSTSLQDDAIGPSQQHLPVSPLSDNLPSPHSRAPSRVAIEVQRRRTNGKQRPTTAVAEPSTDNVALDGNVKDDGRDVSSTATAAAAEGKRAAAGTSAYDVA